jgi:hypothetical protein
MGGNLASPAAAAEPFREALVLGPGPEASDAAALVVGVELEVQADGSVDAADETHARVGLFLHDASSSCRLHYSIDTGIGQPY